MGFFSKLASSADMVAGMASRLGVDNSALIIADPETEAYRYREAVLRCSTCTHTKECKVLQSVSTTLEQTPSYCRNTAHFKRAATA